MTELKEEEMRDLNVCVCVCFKYERLIRNQVCTNGFVKTKGTIELICLSLYPPRFYN